MVFLLSEKNLKLKVASAQDTQAVEGTLVVLTEDDFTNKASKERYFIQKDDGESTEISPGGKLTILPGSRISSINGSVTLISPGDTENSAVLGSNRVAVILVNFNNLTRRIPTKSEAKTLMDTRYSPFFAEMSYRKATMVGDIYGWYTLNILATCDVGEFGQRAITAADPNINYNNYKYVMMVFPNNNCATVGGAYGPPGPRYSTAEGTKNLLVSAYANDYFISHTNFLVGHEMGHSLGVFHANGWECGTNSIGGNCKSIEYGDQFDTMGGSWLASHYGTYYKEFLKWLAPQNIKLVTRSGTYNVGKIETLTNDVQSLKIPREGTSTYYNVENRTATGSDATLPDNARSGALIKIIPNNIAGIITPDASNIIDSAPNSTAGDFSDAGYPLGKVFNDPARGIRITPISKNNGLLTVNVTFYGPKLLSPSNGGATGTQTFDWSNIYQSSGYKIQIARDLSFSDLLVNASTTDSQYKATGLPKNIYLYWRVRTVYSFGSSDWSDTYKFMVPKYSNLSASLRQSRATFNFSYPIPSSHIIEMAITSDFSSGIYRNFGSGTSSPIVVNDPTKWDHYTCGSRLWWRIISKESRVSSIQTAVIDCSSSPDVFTYGDDTAD